MKHLCIINPKAGQVSGRIDEILDMIKGFFSRNPGMENIIHVTRYKRDASGFVMRYVRNTSEIVRVYVFGGGGTLFEVINGVAGFPNVQVAYYPLGKDNDLLTGFAKNSHRAFKSVRNLSLFPAIPIDTILAGNHYFVTNALIGIEADSYIQGRKLSKRLKLPVTTCYYICAFYYAFTKKLIKHYRIEIDGEELNDEYIGICIMNVPGNAMGTPAPESCINDGFMDVYIIKQMPKNLVIKIMKDYCNGKHNNWPQYIYYYRCKKLKISSVKDMTFVPDGEVFYNRELDLEIQPASINFVCQVSIDEFALPGSGEIF